MLEQFLDYSEKTVHIAIAENQTASKAGDKPQIRGLVFNPAKVYAKINTYAEDLYSEFFAPGESYRIAIVRTHMGPGELAKLLGTKFGADNNLAIGGILAPFTLDPNRFEQMWTELTEHPELYLESEEQKVFA